MTFCIPCLKVTYTLWYYRLASFQAEGTKLGRFLAKNQTTHRIHRIFENWSSGELSKIGHRFSNKCAPKLVFFNETKLRKFTMIFDIEN